MKPVPLFLCLVLRKITKHCLVQVKIFLEALVRNALSGNCSVAFKLFVVSVTFCQPYDYTLKGSSDITHWKAISTVFHCIISLPDFRTYQEKLSKDLFCMVSALVQTRVVLLCLCTTGFLWAVLRSARGHDSSLSHGGYLQVRLTSLSGWKRGKIKKACHKFIENGGELEKRDWE